MWTSYPKAFAICLMARFQLLGFIEPNFGKKVGNHQVEPLYHGWMFPGFRVYVHSFWDFQPHHLGVEPLRMNRWRPTVMNGQNPRISDFGTVSRLGFHQF